LAGFVRAGIPPWKLATTILPAATQSVDLYHAREHLHDLAGHLAPVLGDDQPAWLADLDNGDIEGHPQQPRS
jgi:hypothetical protein